MYAFITIRSYNVTADNGCGTNHLPAMGEDPLYSEIDESPNLHGKNKPHLSSNGRPLPEQPGISPAHLQQDMEPTPRYTKTNTQASEYEQPLLHSTQQSVSQSHEETRDTELMGSKEGSRGVATRQHHPANRDRANAGGRMEEDNTNTQHTREATNAYRRIERIDSNTRRDGIDAYDRMERVDARRRDTNNSYDRMERADANRKITNSYDRIDRTSSPTASKDQSLLQGQTSDAGSHETVERTDIKMAGSKNGDTINSYETLEMTDIEAKRNESYDTAERINTSNTQEGTANSYETVERIDTRQEGSANSYDTVERIDTSSNRQEGTANGKESETVRVTLGPVDTNGISSPIQPIESDYAKLSTEPAYAILEHP